MELGWHIICLANSHWLLGTLAPLSRDSGRVTMATLPLEPAPIRELQPLGPYGLTLFSSKIVKVCFLEYKEHPAVPVFLS